MYWIYSSIGSYWNTEILASMEQMTIQHVKTEIQMQKELERARDDRTDEKLLSVSLADLTTILKIYETDPLLKEKSKQYAQIKSLVK